MNVIRETPYGQIAFCPCQNLYHFEFGNIFIRFTSQELQNFKDYVFSIDYKYYLSLNSKARNIRKLMLCVGQENVFFSLHEHEFLALKELLSCKELPKRNLSVNINDFNINLN